MMQSVVASTDAGSNLNAQKSSSNNPVAATSSHAVDQPNLYPQSHHPKGIQLTMQTQSLQISESNASPHNEAADEQLGDQISRITVNVTSHRGSVYRCWHCQPQFNQEYKLNEASGNSSALVGDAHLVNCN